MIGGRQQPHIGDLAGEQYVLAVSGDSELGVLTAPHAADVAFRHLSDGLHLRQVAAEEEQLRRQRRADLLVQLNLAIQNDELPLAGRRRPIGAKVPEPGASFDPDEWAMTGT